ncbi:hypothetical protein KAT73_03465, partial [candidate division WOR-3 bacterium]|nr:hypothetical protein [candidate division WOR-3 bacterium]
MINFDSKKEVYKFLIIAFFTGICIILTYYFHAVLNTGKVFTHFFYIPIILSCLWWKKKGLIVATFLAVLLILSNNFLRTTPITFNDYLRALTFIVIGIIIATMSERISKMMEKIKSEKVFSESIITTIPDSLLILNKDLKIKEANTSFFKIFRIEPENVIGTHIANILGDEGRELIPELQ